MHNFRTDILQENIAFGEFLNVEIAEHISLMNYYIHCGSMDVLTL